MVENLTVQQSILGQHIFTEDVFFLLITLIGGLKKKKIDTFLSAAPCRKRLQQTLACVRDEAQRHLLGMRFPRSWERNKKNPLSGFCVGFVGRFYASFQWKCHRLHPSLFFPEEEEWSKIFL